MKISHNITALVCVVALLLTFCLPVGAEEYRLPATPDLTLNCTGAILMEAETGRVLFEQNADAVLPPASVTKIMTLLLVMEAIERGQIGYTDTVRVSANAASMGGSQIFLKEGEEMCVEDLLKSVIISSANDAAVALAEHVAGSEQAFVTRMNERAAELGMVNTHFENTNGLDDTVTRHVTTARDIALMSAALIRHKKILEYSSIWMDTIRNGAFGLTNTNRLVRFYRGATGLKTGSTAKAGFCVSVTAEREGLSLICVIMAAPTRDIRNAEAARLLDHGFANYEFFRAEAPRLDPLPVSGGLTDGVRVVGGEFAAVVSKGDAKRITCEIELPEGVAAPVREGQVLGRVVYRCDGREIGAVDLCAERDVERIGFGEILWRLFVKIVMV